MPLSRSANKGAYVKAARQRPWPTLHREASIPTSCLTPDEPAGRYPRSCYLERGTELVALAHASITNRSAEAAESETCEIPRSASVRQAVTFNKL